MTERQRSACLAYSKALCAVALLLAAGSGERYRVGGKGEEGGVGGGRDQAYLSPPVNEVPPAIQAAIQRFKGGDKAPASHMCRLKPLDAKFKCLR